jgi:hypothetical protein
VGEFDGRVKYGRLLRPGRSAEDVLFEEKLREDRIRDEDHGVVRWTWPDLRERYVLRDRIRRALERRPDPPRGTCTDSAAPAGAAEWR